MTREEKIIATAFTGKMFIDGSEMGLLYEYMEKKVGHGVIDLMLADKGFWEELHDACEQDFIGMVSKEQPEMDLEEAAEKYLEDEMEKFGERWPYPASFDGYDKDWVDELTEECAKHFYELGKKAMKEQMMEGAVEGKVIVPIYDEGDIWSTEIEIPGRYEPSGSKVKIIVVTEDKK